jgi:integrase
VREGFLSAEQMTKLLAVLPDDDLRDYVEFCWKTGMRKSEAASLRWSFLHDGQINVPQEFCKARKPHVTPVDALLATILKRREAARSFQLNGVTQLCEFVFHRGDGLPICGISEVMEECMQKGRMRERPVSRSAQECRA